MASMTGMTPEQLAQMLAGPNPLPMPTYSIQSIYDGILPSLPPVPMAQFGPLQGSKVNRGAQSEFYQPPIGPADSVAYRNSAPTRLASSGLPPANYGVSSAYSADPSVIARERLPNGEYSDPLQAINEITIRGGNSTPPLPRSRPSVSLPTMPDPLAEALAIGKSYKPSAKVQAALNAPAPPGSPGAPSGRGGGGLLSLLLGGFGGGSAGQGGGLASILSGGGPATGQQLASMQQAAQTAQDPALAAALAAGNKSYVPTNGDPTGVLGYGALMPTVAMNGNPIRNR
jgi:hypothetical protein